MLVAVAAFAPVQRYDSAVTRSVRDLNVELVDRPAPEFELVDLQGRTRRLSDFRGKLVFLNFWASWCPPCREEMPSMRALARMMRGRDFVMVAVTHDTENLALQQFLRNAGISGDDMVILRDPDARIARQFGTELLPETWLIDEHGEIVARFQSARDWTQPEVLDLITRLMRDPWKRG